MPRKLTDEDFKQDAKNNPGDWRARKWAEKALAQEAQAATDAAEGRLRDVQRAEEANQKAQEKKSEELDLGPNMLDYDPRR